MNAADVQLVNDEQHFLDHPSNFDIFVFLQLIEEGHQLADETEGAGHIGARVLQRDLVVRLCVQLGKEKAIHQHLRESIGNPQLSSVPVP